MKKLFIAIFLFLSSNIQAQLLQNESCGHKGFHLSMHKKQLKSLSEFNLDSGKVLYQIPVKFWIYRNNKGKNGLSLKEMKEHIQYLNFYYAKNNTGIRFYIHPDYEFIDKNRFFKLNYISEAPFQTLWHKTKGCINVYVPNKLKKNKHFSIDKNYSGTYNSFTKGVIIAQGISTSTLSHEIGHYLGLKHPHRLWNFKPLQEPVSRDKKALLSKKKLCEKRGDKLCDTPAEPNLTKYTDKKCNYTGWNVTDKYGEVYKPETNNIMSYTNNRECRDSFTNGQIEIMLNKLEKSKFLKYWKTDSSVNTGHFPDIYEPDGEKEIASELFLNTTQTHSFHTIHNKKHKHTIYDNTDWIFFKIDATIQKNLILELTLTNGSNSDLLITVFKENDKISEEKLTDDNYHYTFNKSSLDPGKYYIKISQTTKKESITKFRIKLAY